MPKKEYTKEEKRKKRLQHEFGDNLSYSNKNDMDDYFKGLDEYEYNKVPYFVQTGPAIASKAPSFYLDQEYAFPRMGFYTFMPGDNITKDVEYLKDYSGIPAIYYWNEGTGLFNSIHKPEVAVPGDENYPKLIDNWVDLSNMAGVPAYVGESPQVSKQLPNLVVTPRQKYFIIRQKNGGIMKKLIPKHQQGNRVYLPKKNLIDFIAPQYIEYEPINDNDSQGILFTKGLKSFRREEPKVYGYMGHNVKRYVDYTPISYPSVSETNYQGEGENLEKEYTTEYIKQNNGQLPWWYEGSEPKRAVELPEVLVTTKATPFTRTYDWYNSGYKRPYTITENVGVDRNGNDSIMSSFMINPQGDSLYNTGQFPEVLSPRGEAIFNNRLIRKNNTKEAKQKFMEDYRRAKKTVTY